MSDRNFFEGKALYETGAQENIDWFHAQWKVWPERADERYTTNLSFHTGAIHAYRARNGEDPQMSEELRSCVAMFDKLSADT